MNNEINNQNSQQESGLALIAVLCLMLTVSVLVASAVALSQYAAAEVNTFSSFTRTAYIAEGAANRARWLLLADKKKTPDRTLGKTDYENLDDDRYLADGIVHEMDYYGHKVKFKILDAVSGIDVSGTRPDRYMTFMANQFKDNQQKFEEFKSFCSRILDYVDHDDFLRLDGMEQGDYEQERLFNLPRNRPMQYREELLLIPGMEKYFKPDADGRLSSITIIAPDKMRKLMGRPNLYSAPLSLITQKCNFDESETEQVKEAMKEWKQNRKPFAETLDSGILSKLSIYFSTRESGNYTILVNTSTSQTPGSKLAVTFTPNSTNPKTEYYEYTTY